MGSPADWPAFVARLDGRQLKRHAVLTFNGTWGAGQVQYPSDVVNGLRDYVDSRLCYEVPVPGPYSFGPLGGSVDAPSYQESVQDAVDWASDWIRANPLQTFALGGYSLGGEGASRVAMSLMDGELSQFLPNFIGGYTFGNPSRGAGFHAPGIADPTGRGISATRMTALPTVDGRVVWADYVHSKANGDAALDMYSSVPDDTDGGVGTDMTLAYTAATQIQLHDFGALMKTMVDTLVAGVKDLGLLPGISATQLNSANPTNLLTTMGTVLTGGQSNSTVLGEITGVLLGQPQSGPPQDLVTGGAEALEAAMRGLAFLAAPGGPTGPHISYLGELQGYSNMVSLAVGFLHDLAVAVPARVAS